MSTAQNIAMLDRLFGPTTDPQAIAIRQSIAGLAGETGALSNSSTGVLRADVPPPNPAAPPKPTVPAGSSVSTPQMVARAAITPGAGMPGGSPVAQGFDLFNDMFKNLLMAKADQRAAVDQTISTIQLMNELQRVSPTKAAAFAAALGLPGEEDLSFVNNLDKRANVRVSGQVGRQTLSLPLSLTGRSLSFLNENPTLSHVVQDVANAIGLPDVFARSSAAALPTSSALINLSSAG